MDIVNLAILAAGLALVLCGARMIWCGHRQQLPRGNRRHADRRGNERRQPT